MSASRGARRLGLVVAVLLVAAGVPRGARAAEWGLITPGTTTMDAVRARYGEPSKLDKGKVENYDTQSWTYEGDRAPAGIMRMVVEFGLKVGNGYRPDVVRDFRLQPHGATFNRGIILSGWGAPDRVGREGDSELFLYRSGLLVYFDREGWGARLMIFTLPQASLPAATKPQP